MSTVNTGWLKDNSGEKFAPKTLSSQIVTSDGKSIDVIVADVKSNINSLSESVVYMDEYDDSIDVNTAAVNTGTTTWKLAGYVSGLDTSINIPSDAKELLISAFTNKVGITPPIYQNYALVEQFSTSPSRLFLSGYSISSTDYGYSIVEVTNTKVTLKSFYYNGQSYGADMCVRYR